MIDEVFRKNKTTQKMADAEERFLKISPLPNGSKVVDTRSSRLTYVADPVDDKDAINKSWAKKYFKEEKDAITKLSESATAKSAEIDTKLVKFNSDKDSIERTGEELKVLSAETKTRAEETKAKLESTLAQLEQAKTKIDNFNADYARAKELKGDVEGKATEVKANLESVKAVLNDVTTKSTDILLTYTNAKQDLTNLGSATKREIATTKASIDTRANETLNQASTSLASIKAIVADFKGKQTELNALKASLETLKSSLENLNKSGLINDTEAGIAQTYSSNKINSLLQGVLRESDAAEGNAGGKLVRRNAQGNIYATNIFLNAPTKAEVSDIKSTLATDKWRFIVKDTGEGLLRSMSIKDFISSQEIDAYSKAQSDAKYLTEAKGDARYLSRAEGDTTYMKANNSYDKQQIDQWFVRSYTDVASTSEPNKIVKRTSNGWINVDGIRMYQNNKYAPANNIFKENEKDWVFGLFNEHSLYKVAPTTILGYLKDYFADKATTEQRLNNIPNFSYINKPNGLVRLDSSGKIDVGAIPYKESLVKKENTLSVSLTESKNFVINAGNTSGVFFLYQAVDCIGQSGIIVVTGATKIKSWHSSIKWREVPTDLKDTEVFAYFVASATEVYMGRA